MEGRVKHRRRDDEENKQKKSVMEFLYPHLPPSLFPTMKTKHGPIWLLIRTKDFQFICFIFPYLAICKSREDT